MLVLVVYQKQKYVDQIQLSGLCNCIPAATQYDQEFHSLVLSLMNHFHLSHIDFEIKRDTSSPPPSRGEDIQSFERLSFLYLFCLVYILIIEIDCILLYTDGHGFEDYLKVGAMNAQVSGEEPSDFFKVQPLISQFKLELVLVFYCTCWIIGQSICCAWICQQEHYIFLSKHKVSRAEPSVAYKNRLFYSIISYSSHATLVSLCNRLT